MGMLAQLADSIYRGPGAAGANYPPLADQPQAIQNAFTVIAENALQTLANPTAPMVNAAAGLSDPASIFTAMVNSALNGG